MSIKEVISEGEPFEVEYLDRSTNGKRTTALKVSGTGSSSRVDISAPLTVTGVLSTPGGISYTGDVSATGNITAGGRINATGYIHTASDLSVVGSASVGGKPVLAGAPFYCKLLAGVAAAGPVTATGVKVGDKVVGVLNVTDGSDGASSFEATVTVNDQIQQSNAADLHLKNFYFIVVKQS